MKNMVYRMKNILRLLLTVSLLCLCGCGSAEDKTIIQYPDGVEFTGTLVPVEVPEAGFSTKMDESLTHTYKSSDGVYIYTRKEGTIPYVLINYYPGQADYLETYLAEDSIGWMKDHYGDDLLEISEVEDMTYEGKPLRGFTAKYNLDGAEINFMEVCEIVDEGIADYILKFEDSAEPYTMAAFKTALKEFSVYGSGTSGTSSTSGTETTKETTVTIQETRAEQLAKTMKQIKYGDLITMNIPASWEVSIGGYNMGTWIHAYDPADPTLQVFTGLKLNMLLKNDKAKAYWESRYRASGQSPLLKGWGEAVVNSSGTVREFFESDFGAYCQYLTSTDPSFAGFYYPSLERFQVLEEYNVTNMFSSVAVDNKLIHATFTDQLSQGNGEGMFAGSLVDLLPMMDPGYDAGVYGIYTMTGMSAPYGMLGEYLPLLSSILNSIEYSDTFIESVAQEEQITIENARQVNTYMQQTMDIVTEGWNARQKSYDIQSQQYSDSVLGYDRYLDTETNEVYRVEYGALDGYQGSRYQKIDQGSAYYTEPVAGYIVK